MIVGRWITNASILRQRLEYLHCLKKFTKITRDFQRFRRLVVCVQAITHYHPNFRSFLLKAVTLKQYYYLIELDRISDLVTVSAVKFLCFGQFRYRRKLHLYSRHSFSYILSWLLASEPQWRQTPKSLSSSSRVYVVTPANRVIVGHYFRYSISHLIFRPVGRSIDWVLN